MASDYLISKWKLWYTWFDINNDGKVDFEDAEAERSKFSKLHHLSDEEKKSVMEEFGNWWKEYILWGQAEMTEPKFVELMNDAYKADKAKFLERMQTCFDKICNIVDTNNDGDISLEEFNIIMRSAGHKDKSLDEKFFENYKPVDGKVPIKVISDSWVQFTTCEDSTKHDLVKAAFEFGV
ncbi:sarcoplasmic calcium-binding protein-like [Mercenaria mercenaria]|uniref:sarcoplasmic calcium-binding protein-like n=1 Tax=Mercenaria mercenaria TaxID=6596 RepID=UPI00234FA44E|nr:sarcoplasmic calcium-binding protein-like [Mercenaria mercenaria]